MNVPCFISFLYSFAFLSALLIVYFLPLVLLICFYLCVLGTHMVQSLIYSLYGIYRYRLSHLQSPLPQSYAVLSSLKSIGLEGCESL